MLSMLNSFFSNSLQDCINKALRNLERKAQARLLDCGCGDGETTLRVAEAIGTNDIYGVDIDEEALKVARSKGIKAYKADLNQRLPFEDNYFCIVFSNQVMEHLDKTDRYVKEVFRVLKPSGYAIIATENLASWHNIFALLLGYQDFSSQGPSIEYRIGNPLSPYYGIKIPNKDVYLMHRKIFTYQSLREIFEFHSFKVEKLIGAGYYPFPKWLSSALSSLDPRHAAFMMIKAKKVLC